MSLLCILPELAPLVGVLAHFHRDHSSPLASTDDILTALYNIVTSDRVSCPKLEYKQLILEVCLLLEA